MQELFPDILVAPNTTPEWKQNDPRPYLPLLELPQDISFLLKTPTVDYQRNVSTVQKPVFEPASVTSDSSQNTSPQSTASSDSDIDVGNSSPQQDVLNHFSTSSIFGGLCEVLREDCTVDSVPHALMDASRPNFHVPLSVRVGMLQLCFMSVAQQHRSQVTQLQHVYSLKSGQLETERMNYLTRTQLVSAAYASVNLYFDGLHHQLIDDIEKNLDLMSPVNLDLMSTVNLDLMSTVNNISFPINKQCSTVHEQSDISTKKVKRIVRPSHVKSNLGPVSVRIMENWYKRHQEHPYPSYDAAEVMAKAGNISVEQVKKWFANKRRRLHNTNTLTEIARRRKRTAEPLVDEFDSAAKRARQA